MKKAKTLISLAAIAVSAAMLFTSCGTRNTADSEKETEDPVTTSAKEEKTTSHRIVLSGGEATIDGEKIPQYDYTWHCDPGVSHSEVEDAPAEYYTGEKPDETLSVYIDHELYYFPFLPADGFKAINYDGETEWAYYYTDGEHDDYIFATLPHLTPSVPTDMMFSEEEAGKNKVLHIKEAGEYLIEGEWQGQINVDLGENAAEDPDEKITLILNGVDVTCTAAPAVLINNAYECDGVWEAGNNSQDVDTSDAGVNVIIADGTENNVSGKNVYRMLKTVLKNAESGSAVQKKMRKTDAAFYSCVSMNIDGGELGDGVLNVTSGFEGVDTELHLTVLGGNIIINSQDDGINVNEDNVSVARFKGGNVTVNHLQGAEGDGVDSNGYIVMDGGTVCVNGVMPPDTALDSQCGMYFYSGDVIVDGEKQEYKEGDVIREEMGGAPERPGDMPEMPDEGFPGNGAPGNGDPEPGK